MEILFATTNEGKLREMRSLAAPLGISIISSLERPEIHDSPPCVQEGTVSYHENARMKARAFFKWSGGFPTLADDAGLEVDALGGLPGVSSARYAGEHAGDSENIEKLLGALQGKNDRSARFRCVLCFINGLGEAKTCEATLEGVITETPRGSGGFGYDPVFEVAGFGETLAVLKETFQPRTHRALALESLSRGLV